MSLINRVTFQIKMRAQFTKDERNFIALEYHKRKNGYGFKAGLISSLRAVIKG